MKQWGYHQLHKGILLIASIALCQSAYAIDPIETVGIQLGFDLQYRSQTFEKGRGERLFRKHAFQMAPYTSYIGKGYGGELGITHSSVASRSTTQSPPTLVLEETIAATQEHQTRVKLDGWYATLLRKQKIPLDNFQMHIAGGISHLVLRAEDNRLSPTTFNRKFTKSKFVPRLELGLEYQSMPNIGFRWRVIWENMKRFKVTNENAVIQGKNQYIHSFGVFYKF